MSNNNSRAVLFDYDGVLADTLENHFTAWKRSFSDLEVQISRKDYFPTEGMQLIDFMKRVTKKYGIQKPDYGSILKRKESYFSEDYKFSLFPGVLSLVNKLKKNAIKIAVVTAGHKGRLYNTNPKYFLDKFDFILTGDLVKRGKPYPDPYLKAMATLEVKAESCIVVENASLGIKSAKSAGAYCIAVCSSVGKDLLSEADEIVNKFSDLKETKKIRELIC